MSTTVTFAGNLAEAPELHHTWQSKPLVTCLVVANRRFQADQGQWVSDEPTAHNVRNFGSAADHVHDICGSGDPIFVHGLELTHSWPDKEPGEKRTKNVVIVDSRLDEVGLSLEYVSRRIDRAPHAGQVSREGSLR